MQISDDFAIDDEVTGLRITVIPGNNLDRLHIESIRPNPNYSYNRDFWFTKEGQPALKIPFPPPCLHTPKTIVNLGNPDV